MRIQRLLHLGLGALALVAGSHASAQGAPPGATALVTVSVPAAMAAPPFDVPRQLKVPVGFSIGVFARQANARFMAVAPNGDLLLSSPSTGVITLLRPNGKFAGASMVFASGLKKPHDIVFHTIAGKTWVYVAESNRIIRALYHPDMVALGKPQVVVDNLPDLSTPEVKGSYHHPLKNIALNGNKLYVAIASTCNACESDVASDPIRNAIYEYDADGGHRRLYARGIRNAEGVRFKPGTNDLWVVVNNRDNIAYPFHKDFDGDGSDDYGKVMPAYVDGHPPDMLIKVRDGGNYGWPYCNSNPDGGLDNMPFDRDIELNADGAKLDCTKADRITRGLTPHSAPLGMNFLQDSGLPAPYRNAMVIGEHGCWNCTAFIGHKLVLYPFKADGTLGEEVELVSGWVSDAKAKQRWGRPVSAIGDGHGGLYISDDFSGTVYLLSSK
jgi:glucose/arabinose dehydrogenase